jgi:type VI secretion system secreted protein Hcp
MRQKILWVAAALVLIGIPAVIGLIALGDDGDRRSAALVQEGAGGYQLVIPGITATGQAIEVLSFSWGGTANATVGTGGLTAGRAQFGDLQITKKVDTASPLLGMGLSKGTHYPSAKLTLYKGSAAPAEYMIYTMTDVLITSLQHGGSADEVPSEQISLAYAKLQVTAKDVRDDGKVGGQTTFLYDIAAKG